MLRFLSAFAGALLLTAPTSVHASPGDLDRSFANDGRMLVRTSGAVTGMTLIDERRPMLTVQPTKDADLNGDPFTLALSAAGRVLERGPVPAPGPFALPDRFVVRASDVDGAGRTVVIGAVSPGDDRALRFLPDGGLDTSYGNGGSVELTDVSGPFIVLVKPGGQAHIFDEDSQVVLDTGGRSLLGHGEPNLTWPRNQRGALDAATDGPGDTVLVLGRSVDNDPFVMRLGADGRRDPRFGKRGLVILSRPWFSPSDIIRDRRGRLLIGGITNRNALVARLTARGRLDAGFGRGGRARIAPPPGLKGWDAGHLALDAHDRIVVAGSGWTRDEDVGAFRPVVARLKAR
jgi:uncharacterized delta-60 repeat protein